MTLSLEQIEQAIEQLPREDWEQLERWLAEYRASKWDEQIETDVKAGRLNHLITQARTAHLTGNSRPLEIDIPFSLSEKS